MLKTIWTCWLQGRESAPPLVETCLSSWERQNPGWQFRCLDAGSTERYVPVSRFIDLERQVVTAASLSDIVRLLLLRSFGGVWVDATVLCNRPLDGWLPGVMSEGFFAFAAPGHDRPLASWFLSADADSYLTSSWCRSMVEYWSPDRTGSTDYFWLHHLFGELCRTDPRAEEAWHGFPAAALPDRTRCRSGAIAQATKGMRRST